MSRNKTLGIAAALIAVLGLQAYALISTRSAIEEKLAGLEVELQSVRETSAAQTTQIASDLGVVTERMGVTTQELEDARKTAEQLRQEQARAAARFRSELEASSKAVDTLREESTTKIAKVEEQASTQIGAVSGEVQTVKVDLDATKTDLASSRKEMVDLRDSLGREIARNSSQLDELRRRGERNFVEFNIPKAKTMSRVADIQVQLRKADLKRQKYDITLQVDDAKLEKNGQLLNEPVTFLVGKDRHRYELVVFAVEKDRIRGYVSTPKDKVLSAEGPSFR